MTIKVHGQYFNLEIVKPVDQSFQDILSPEALDFLCQIGERFTTRIEELLDARKEVQARINHGEMPDFLVETEHIRSGNWKADPLPQDLLDRRVEITGPVDRKMIINALNSGANVFMADFEDSNSPTWENVMRGQVNLFEAIRGTISFTNNKTGKTYELGDHQAVLMVRPRGLHLKEAGIKLNDEPIYGALVDFALYFFHNAKTLLEKGKQPYFYLPKLQHYKEARLWNDIFCYAQDILEIPRGSIKATVLLEHILAAFQMNEIIYELRQHSAGLNSGRWDYIFSFIKTFSQHPTFVLPDRVQLGMDRHFLSSYVTLLIQTCHRRGVSAMGGMAAQIPIKDNLELNNQALEKVRQDKIREAQSGHDGTWVAHPGLIKVAKQAFDETLTGTNQLDIIPAANITAHDLLSVPQGSITENGVRININVGIRYLASWLSGLGCVPIFNLMEDAATAEISRSQLWQWVKYEMTLDDGRVLDKSLFEGLLDEELKSITSELVDKDVLGKFNLAASIFQELTFKEELPEFLTLEAYNHLEAK